MKLLLVILLPGKKLQINYWRISLDSVSLANNSNLHRWKISSNLRHCIPAVDRYTWRHESIQFK